MLALTLDQSKCTFRRILCVGAHCDDIEIGCGGTILRWLAEDPNREIHWIVFSSTPERAREARRSAALFLKQAKRKKVVIHKFRDGFFPYHGARIKEVFERLKRAFSPDVVMTHYRHDLHQDHRLLSELTWNTFRNHLILEYEIPKYDGDLGSPNCFVYLDQNICDRKVRLLFQLFRTQLQKQWFTAETFEALLRLRGIESNAQGQFAEAFYCRKIVLDTSRAVSRGTGLAE